MGRVRFTRRCFEEDLRSLPAWARREAIRLAKRIERDPDVGKPLAPPLDRFRRLWLRSEYRMVYTYDRESDTWWIYLIARRKPGRRDDVYEILRRLVEQEDPLR